jgi:hypothetical protein
MLPVIKASFERRFLLPTLSFALAGAMVSYADGARAQGSPPAAEPPPSDAAPTAPPSSPSAPQGVPPNAPPTAPGGAQPVPAGPPGPPPASPPPYMVQQPWTPPPGEPPPPPRYARPAPRPPQYQAAPPYGPPPYPPPGYSPAYVYEPPPPPPRMHRTPYNSLWLGGRIGVLFPYGNAFDYDITPTREIGERWDGLASTGIAFEADAGLRLARHYIFYGFWEHAELSTGSDESWRTGATNYGDQSFARTEFPGVGFRWTSRPDSVGLVVDTGIGYRWFRERWASDTEMRLRGGEFRIGFGADVRINQFFSLSPLIMFSFGAFTSGDLVENGGPRQTLQFLDASHGSVTLSVGGHFDLGG